MKIRTVTNDDFEQINEVYKKYWDGKLEPPGEGRLVEALVEDDDGSMIAYGCLKMWGEVLMIMDTSKSMKKKTEALTKLMLTARMSAQRAGLDSINVFTNNESYAKLLEKHYGCERVDTIILRMKLE